MTRAEAEARGWIFELDEEGGQSHARKTSIQLAADKTMLPSELHVAVYSDTPEETLLANIAELEGVPFVEGYGIEGPPVEPVPTPLEQAREKLAKMPKGKQITAGMLADLLGNLSG